MRPQSLIASRQSAWHRAVRARLACTLRCRRSGAEAAPRVCSARSIRVGANVGTTLVAPSRLAARSTLAPFAPTTQQRSTCARPHTRSHISCGQTDCHNRARPRSCPPATGPHQRGQSQEDDPGVLESLTAGILEHCMQCASGPASPRPACTVQLCSEQSRLHSAPSARCSRQRAAHSQEGAQQGTAEHACREQPVETGPQARERMPLRAQEA